MKEREDVTNYSMPYINKQNTMNLTLLLALLLAISLGLAYDSKSLCSKIKCNLVTLKDCNEI